MTGAGLLRWDGRRLGKAASRAGARVWLAIVLVAIPALGLLRTIPVPAGGTPRSAALWGFAIAAPIVFFAYGVLLRPADGHLLRRLGIPGSAIFPRQTTRFLGAVLVAIVAAAVALAGRTPGSQLLATAVAAGLAAWGLAIWIYAAAASAVGSPSGRGMLTRAVAWDRELAAAAPLVYAPLVPLIGGIAAAAWVGTAAGGAWGRVAVVGVASGAAALWARRPFTETLARWMPVLSEMAFAPPPDAAGAGLVTDRGVARLLPRRASAVWARDAAVLARRFRWAGRLAWPVAGIGVIALARAGDEPAVRGWVAIGAGLALAAQAAAVVGLGATERGRWRWVDRSLGLGGGVRWLGRWALGLGLMAWIAVPLGLAWAFGVPGASGWIWIFAAAGVAGVAALASVTVAGR